VATGGVATASSVYTWHEAALAFDGDHSICDDPHSFISQASTIEWFQVDLKHIQIITSIHIYHQTDCCPDQTLGSQVIISASVDYSAGMVCGTLDEEYAQPETVSCIGQARYVTIVGDGSRLRLCEVEVFTTSECIPISTACPPSMLLDRRLWLCLPVIECSCFVCYCVFAVNPSASVSSRINDTFHALALPCPVMPSYIIVVSSSSSSSF
jgi:hypothetical protein